MTELAAFYGFDVHKHFMYCPFHGEKTPSLRIYDNDRGWHCFGCGEGNSNIDFVMKLFNLPFMQACNKIISDFNLPMKNYKALSYREQLQQNKALEQISEHKQKLTALKAECDSLFDELTAIEHFIVTTPKPTIFDDEKQVIGYCKAKAKHERLTYELEQAEREYANYEQQQRSTNYRNLAKR